LLATAKPHRSPDDQHVGQGREWAHTRMRQAGEEHEVTAVFAYRLWEKRGRPVGSPEVDWFEAKNQLATELAKSEALIALSAVHVGNLLLCHRF
jgi:hypothetical protein